MNRLKHALERRSGLIWGVLRLRAGAVPPSAFHVLIAPRDDISNMLVEVGIGRTLLYVGRWPK